MDLNAVHAVEFDMLAAVTELCDKYHIAYSLYCGTLLGAVRHGGFIPWDDDIDMAMPLKDYRRFLRAAHELPPQYVCSHLGNTREFFLLWTKVSAEGTTAMPVAEAGLNIPWGVYMDIYPMIGAADSKIGLRVQRWLLDTARRLRSVDIYRVLGENGFGKKLLSKIPFVLRKALSGLFLSIAMRDPEKSKHVGTLDAALFWGKFEWSDWTDMTKLQFEGRAFSAPSEYDKLLRIMYGDYMQLPPEERRVPHVDAHGQIIIDTNRDYRLYQKEMCEP